MARKDFWKSDWFLGLVVAIAVFLLSATDLVGSLEGKACDLSVRASAHAAGGDIALVTGDPSIADIRRWPWSGEVRARLTEGPRAAHAKVIG